MSLPTTGNYDKFTMQQALVDLLKLPPGKYKAAVGEFASRYGIEPQLVLSHFLARGEVQQLRRDLVTFEGFGDVTGGAASKAAVFLYNQGGVPAPPLQGEVWVTKVEIWSPTAQEVFVCAGGDLQATIIALPAGFAVVGRLNTEDLSAVPAATAAQLAEVCTDNGANFAVLASANCMKRLPLLANTPYVLGSEDGNCLLYRLSLGGAAGVGSSLAIFAGTNNTRLVVNFTAVELTTEYP